MIDQQERGGWGEGCFCGELEESIRETGQFQLAVQADTEQAVCLELGRI